MKIINIKLGDQTFMSGKISTYLTREAMKLQRDALALGEKAKDLKDDTNGVEALELFDAIDEQLARKIWLICETYENKFTPDLLERNLSTEEIDQEVQKIIGTASGVIEKN